MIVGPNSFFVSNADAPQGIDMAARALGFGLIIASSLASTNTGFGAEYQHGTHAAAVYESQFKGAIFPASKGNVPANAVRSLIGGPQQVDLTLQARLFAPMTKQSLGIGQEYQFGTHQLAIANSQIQPQVWSSVAKAAPLTNLNSFPLTFAQPQELNKDLTLQGWVSIPSVPQGWLLTMIGAGPQAADFTQQASIQRAIVRNINAAWTPTTIIGVWQQNPTQIPAQVTKPRGAAAPVAPLRTFFASQEDPTQREAKIFPALQPPPKPSHVVQPAIVLIQQQTYSDVYLQPFAQPRIGGAGPPPPLDGFRVTAVTAGYYGGRFRTPGDVFDINYAAEYSDSTIDYQNQPSGLQLQGGGLLLLQGGGIFSLQTSTEGSTSGYGWMLRVAQSTPIFDWLQSNGAPYLPPQDPRRRFIY